MAEAVDEQSEPLVGRAVGQGGVDDAIRDRPVPVGERLFLSGGGRERGRANHKGGEQGGYQRA